MYPCRSQKKPFQKRNTQSAESKWLQMSFFISFLLWHCLHQVHGAESALRIGVALRSSEPEQPPRLGNVCRPAWVAQEHAAESAQRIGVTLFCSKP